MKGGNFVVLIGLNTEPVPFIVYQTMFRNIEDLKSQIRVEINVALIINNVISSKKSKKDRLWRELQY